MKNIIKNYTFDKTAKTVTFTDFNVVGIRLDRILLITNVTTNTLIYQFNNSALGGTVAANVLTLTFNTTSMNNADKLQIIYQTLDTDPTNEVEPVSVASLPLPAGASTSANQTTGNSSLATIASNTTGGATSANQTNGTQQAKLTDGTNVVGVLKADGTAAGQGSLLTAGTYLEKTGSAGSATTVIAATDVSNYKWWSLQITGMGTAVLVWEGSNDNTNWVTLMANQLGSSTANFSNATSVNGIFHAPITSRYIRFRLSSWTSGTIVGTLELYTSPAFSTVMQANQQGTWNIGTITPGTANTSLGKAEDAAAGSGDTGVAVWGVRNDTLADVTNASGDYSQQSTDIKGRMMTANAPRGLKGMTQTQLSATTSETTIITATASTFHDVYGLILANTGASTTKVSIRDDTAGTVRAIIEVPTLETRGFMLPIDAAMPQTAVNKNWTAQCGTATTALEVTALYVSMV